MNWINNKIVIILLSKYHCLGSRERHVQQIRVQITGMQLASRK